jgi:hypothetical protein
MYVYACSKAVPYFFYSRDACLYDLSLVELGGQLAAISEPAKLKIAKPSHRGKLLGILSHVVSETI